MAGFGKWLGGGLGWAFGGPIGAIIGFAVGSMFDTSGARKTQTNNTESTQNDFKISLLILIACIMKADGKVQKAELAVVKRFLSANFGEENALEALQLLKRILEQEINESEVAQQISRHLNYSSKLQLLHLLIDIALADGEAVASEMAIIERISNNFGISHADFESLKAPHFKKTDTNWAYKALEIEPTATDEEVKKAYRRMAMKFHPDKVTNLGSEMHASASEKFRSINQAYEAIKKIRALK